MATEKDASKKRTTYGITTASNISGWESKQTKIKERPYIYMDVMQGRGGFYMYVYKCMLAKSSSF